MTPRNIRTRVLALVGAAFVGTTASLTLGQFEFAKLSASDAAWGDSIGWSVSINGDRVIVGAPGDDDAGIGSGAAYVFRREDNGTPSDPLDDLWVQEAKIRASDAAASDDFGMSVSINGDRAVVGAPGNGFRGSAYVFRWDDNGTPADPSDDLWVEEAKLIPSDGNAGNEFGKAVSINGAWIVVGDFAVDDACPGDVFCDSGAAYVFRRDDNGTPADPSDDFWVQEAKLTASDPARGDRFGFSLAISGDVTVLGAPHDDCADGSFNCGSAYVFRREVSGWVEMGKIVASDLGASDDFGSSVSISGDRIVVGSMRDNDGGSESGSAYVFRRDDNGTPTDPSDDFWAQEAKLTASDAAAGDYFGGSVSISGDRVVAGAPGDDDAGSSSGSAYLFRREEGGTPGDPSDDIWVQEAKIRGSDAAASDVFGWSVSVSGEWAVVGAYGDDDACPGDEFCNSGAAYVYLVEGDCNGNGVFDETDIADGTSRDCNGNGIPDECEIDCQPNCVPDDCDIAAGTSDDENGDGIPDECAAPTGGSFRVQVDPPIPLESEPVTVTASATFPDNCVELCGVMGEWAGPSQYHVDFYVRDLHEPGAVCLDVVTTLTSQFPLGALDPADYRVTATEYITNWDAACDEGTLGDQTETTFRVLVDCNGNGTTDSCDIIGGNSGDCNGNGIPDDCEPDCNGNGLADDCDVLDGTSEDCNANGIPDECEVDCNGNGLADDCECVGADAPGAQASAGANNRYLSLLPDPASSACRTALRVTLTDLPAPLDVYNGTTMWVGQPLEFSENSGKRMASEAPGWPTFWGAGFQCQPHYTDRSALGALDMYHELIVPGATYEVQAIGEGCDPGLEESYSPPLALSTGMWADVVGPFDGTAWSRPDESVDVTTDVVALLDTFANRPGAPSKAQADLGPTMPDQIIDIRDVTLALDAFRGVGYPFSGSAGCP